MTDKPYVPPEGLEHISSVSAEQIPAVLGTAKAGEIALHCSPEAVKQAYLLQSGMNLVLGRMQKALWRRTSHTRNGPEIATRDPAVIADYREGKIRELVDTFIAPNNPHDPQKSAIVISEGDGEVTIGGRGAIEWLQRNDVAASPTRSNPHG